MTPRVVLELLLERLEPEVGTITRANFLLKDGKPWQTNELLLSGKLHLAEAVLRARAALTSNDESRIVSAAIHCASFERTGRQVETERTAQEADAARTVAAELALNATEEKRKRAKNQKKGGDVTGAQQAAKSAKAWEPWVRMYEAALAGGVPYQKARRSVKGAMARAGFVLPKTNMFPGDRSLSDWLPNPNK